MGLPAEKIIAEATKGLLNLFRRKPSWHGLIRRLDDCGIISSTFPFGVLFRDRADRIEIIAVMHLRREPGYWKERV